MIHTIASGAKFFEKLYKLVMVKAGLRSVQHFCEYGCRRPNHVSGMINDQANMPKVIARIVST